MPLSFTMTYRFESDGDGTLLTMDSQIQSSGCMMNLVGKSVCGVFKNAIQKDFDALNEYLKSRQAV
ncbi:MAG: hypothetical protein ACIAQF_11865 [Phycisphaerales bacterium JB065]